MFQNIEIEFKNMLTKEEYELLLIKFTTVESKLITQENHYFDTKDFALKNEQSALRIRQKGQQFEMTLKQPANIGLLETTQNLTEAEATLSIQEGKLPSGAIKEIISKMDIVFSKLSYFGSLKTNRAEMNYKGGILVLDHSLYLNKEDYELEYEVENEQLGQKIFEELLNQYNIPHRKTENKIQRFYNQKNLLKNSAF
ncbi:CYTH domain-containing protein [Bacillus salipaludis]|uniref:CYTH domain-containing protein n=1 Tax=Bacillus salipaludis TaxID=2547811 RepID=A0AA90TVM0_9BACI|nr:CYTH domain-containing protein [Bacillus salipaludis]MDQ6596563.1 CYTH domain-containing protein [Bacillus salipaludis]